MNFAICDDNKDFCRILEKYLIKYQIESEREFEINVFYDIQSLKDAECENEFDLIFLDIEFPEDLEIELVALLNKNNNLSKNVLTRD